MTDIPASDTALVERPILFMDEKGVVYTSNGDVVKALIDGLPEPTVGRKLLPLAPAARLTAMQAELERQREHIRKQAEDIMTLGRLVYPPDGIGPDDTWKSRALSSPSDREAVAVTDAMVEAFKAEFREFSEIDFRSESIRDCLAAALALSAPGMVPSTIREAMQLAIEYLKETKHGSPARSPGHNARLVLEAALAASPSQTKESDHA